MTDKELKEALKRLGFIKTVNKRSPNKSIYDSKPVDKLVTKWGDIEGNVEDSEVLMNKLVNNSTLITTKKEIIFKILEADLTSISITLTDAIIINDLERGIYDIECVPYFNSPLLADIKFNIECTNGTGVITNITLPTDVILLGNDLICATTGNDQQTIIKGHIDLADKGSVTLKWAQDSASGTSTLYKNTYIKLIKWQQ